MRRWFGWIFSIAVCMFAFTANGQESSSRELRASARSVSSMSSEASSVASQHEPPQPSGQSRRALLLLTPEREAAALTFVERHHRELVDILRYLKEERPKAYEQAMLELFRVSERLAQHQMQSDERYEIELALWKIESRIELLAARLKMAGLDSPAGQTLAPQLEKLLEQRLELRMKRLAWERCRIAERMERIDRQIEHARVHREQNLRREFERLVTGPSRKAVSTSAPRVKSDGDERQTPR